MSQSEDDGPGRREVAYRMFATEYDQADLQYAESEDERAPNFVVTPTGGRVNRLFVVGVLTEVEPVSEGVLRGRVVDPTGAFVCYAGQYQPDERATLDRLEPPEFVAVTGKARTFQPDDGDRVFTSVRPESVSTVDADTRDRWTLSAAERTLERVEAMATAIALEATGDRLREALLDRGYDEGLAAGIPVALDHYGTTPTYLDAIRNLAIDAARHVAGELEEVAGQSIAPDTDGEMTVGDLLSEPVEPLASTPTEELAAESETAAVSGTENDIETTPQSAGSVSEDSEPSDELSGDLSAESSADVADSDTETEGQEEPAQTDDPAADYELDADERAAVESEYGTEFQSAAEVDEPGEADIETPEPETEAPPEDAVDASADAGPEPDDGDPTDLVDDVVSTMASLDDGDGAAREAVVEAVAERTGAEPAAVEDAIQDALMDGRCYEPDDGTLKPI